MLPHDTGWRSSILGCQQAVPDEGDTEDLNDNAGQPEIHLQEHADPIAEAVPGNAASSSIAEAEGHDQAGKLQ